MLQKIRLVLTLATLTLSNLACIGDGGISSSGRPANAFGYGIEFDSGLFLQQYWRNNQARYLILNARAERKEITARRIAQGSPTAGGPWVIDPLSTVDVVAPVSLGEDDPGLAFIGKDGKFFGALPAPTRNSRIPSTSRLVLDASLNGIRGSGGSNLLWFELVELSAPHYADFFVTLRVMGDFFAIRLADYVPAGIPGMPAASTLVDARSDDLRVAQVSGETWVYRDGANPAAIHDVRLRWRGPAVSPVAMTRIGAQVCVRYSENGCEYDQQTVVGIPLR